MALRLARALAPHALLPADQVCKAWLRLAACTRLLLHAGPAVLWQDCACKCRVANQCQRSVVRGRLPDLRDQELRGQKPGRLPKSPAAPGSTSVSPPARPPAARPPVRPSVRPSVHQSVSQSVQARTLTDYLLTGYLQTDYVLTCAGYLLTISDYVLTGYFRTD